MNHQQSDVIGYDLTRSYAGNSVNSQHEIYQARLGQGLRGAQGTVCRSNGIYVDTVCSHNITRASSDARGGGCERLL